MNFVDTCQLKIENYHYYYILFTNLVNNKLKILYMKRIKLNFYGLCDKSGEKTRITC